MDPETTFKATKSVNLYLTVQTKKGDFRDIQNFFLIVENGHVLNKVKEQNRIRATFSQG